jgi:hypothetical protein
MLLLVVVEQKMAVVKLVLQPFDLDLVVRTEVDHRIVFHRMLHSNNSPLGMESNINKFLDYLESYTTDLFN